MAVALADQVRATVELPAVAARFNGAAGTEAVDDDDETEELDELELETEELDELEEAEDVDEDDEVDGELEIEDELEELSPPAPPPQPASITNTMSVSPRNAARAGQSLNIMDFLENATG